MALFRYRARSASGQLKTGETEAASAEVLAAQLRDGGLIPVDIQVTRSRKDPLQGILERLALEQRVRLDDLIHFCRQMYTLVKAGVPIIRALKGLAKTTQNRTMARAVLGVAEDLEAGHGLSRALARYPRVFPPMLCNMVEVGETTGRLDESFLSISGYLIEEKDTIDQVKTAMRYPSFVVIAIGVAIGVVSLFVVPTFENVFAKMGTDLPLPTKIIMATSRFARDYWPALMVAGVVLSLAGRRFLQTSKGGFWWDRVKLRLPVVGPIVLRASLARFARAFAMTFQAGVPLADALSLTANSVGNTYVGSRIARMQQGLERGDTLTRSAASVNLFTPLVLQLLEVGEETGEIDTMLRDVGEYYEREVAYDLKNLTSAIEPILVIFMGVVVLVLALGIFLPMWNLTDMARGH